MKRHNILAGIILGIIGFAVNWFKLELFFNVDFLFGSIITMFALMRYGLAAGTIAALVAATCTWHHWHHPWAIIIFTAEAFVAGLLAKKRGWELLSAVIIFWSTAGLLLVWLLYNQVMGLPFQSSLLIALKQGVNGIFNTLVAMGIGIVVAYRDSRKQELPSLYQTLFVSLALFVLIPVMGYLYFDIQKSLDLKLENYRKNTARIGEVSEHTVSLWLTLNRDTVNSLAGLVGSQEHITQPEMQRIVEIMRSTNPEFARMGIYDKSSITRAFSPLRDENGASTIGVDLSGRAYIKTLQSPSHPFVCEVFTGVIGTRGPRLILLAPLLKSGNYQGAAFGVVSFSALKHLLLQVVDNRPVTITLVDHKGRVVSSTRDSLKPLDMFVLQQNSFVTSISDGVSHWIPGHQPGISSVKRWFSSFYVKEIPLTFGNGWKVIVESSLKPPLEEISRQTSLSLGVVALLIIVFIMLSRQIATRYTSVLQKLEDATRQLPQRISSGEVISWPKPITRELAGLTDNFQLTSETIQKHVMELEALNVSLEQRVEERTIQLSKTMHELHIILDNSPIGISKIVDRKQVWVNRKYEELFQYSSAELESQSTRQLYLSEAEYEKLGRESYPVLALGKVFEDEIELVQKGGDHILVRYISKAIDPSDMSKGVLWLLEDITERRQAELAQRESESKYRLLFDNAGDAIFIHDVKARMLAVNPLACERLGYTQAELMSMTIDLVDSPEQGRYAPDRITRLMAQGHLIFETVHQRKDGSPVPTEVSSRKIIWQGQTAMMSICRDITGRKQMEDELRQALEAAEAVNVTMNRLLRIIAHEFRSPLGVLTGSTDILDLYWDRLTPEKRFTQHEHIRSAARQLTDLISSVIAFNQMGTDRVVTPPLVLDIGEICSAITASVELVWGAGQKCTVTIAPDCGTALLNESLFRRTVENLLSNAFRYTPADGAVSFAVCREESSLCMEISDTGIGIPAEDQAMIFDAFFRSRNVLWRGGLGLGLSIVSESLTQMGGTIRVNSSIGEGTTMRVEIPLDSPTQQ
jgi:PAS domain S-box-containing protein